MNEVSPGRYDYIRVVPNPYAAGGYFDKHKMMQKSWKLLKPWQMGTHLRVLSKSIPMNTNMKGFR